MSVSGTGSLSDGGFPEDASSFIIVKDFLRSSSTCTFIFSISSNMDAGMGDDSCGIWSSSTVEAADSDDLLCLFRLRPSFLGIISATLARRRLKNLVILKSYKIDAGEQKFSFGSYELREVKLMQSRSRKNTIRTPQFVIALRVYSVECSYGTTCLTKVLEPPGTI
mmetsp:Transcript_8695/g.12298  ORF Transcript_8695/g.12298 Transcript_8695/m.12298 type:complete len:166 (+) Transcript_8695:2079-2576(+)